MLPLIIIWFGIGIWSKVAVVFLGAVIPIVISAFGREDQRGALPHHGAESSASRLKIFASIILPGTVPFIFTGLKYAAGRALLGVVVGELYAATAGLGHMIADAGNMFQTERCFSASSSSPPRASWPSRCSIGSNGGSSAGGRKLERLREAFLSGA